MKKTAIRAAALLLCICIGGITAFGVEYLVPVGQVIGLELSNSTVTVAAFDDTLGAKARSAGLCAGDQILSIDGKSITCAEDVRQALRQSNGAITVKLQRKDRQQTLQLKPEVTPEGPKLGVFLKEGVTGIGTVTWYDPDSKTFGTLGHGVNGSDGKLLRLTAGKAYRAKIASVQKGKVGQPGQLRGTLSDPASIGELTANTDRGLFGKAYTGWDGTALPVAQQSEVRPGAATILSTIAGDGPQEYSVEILKLYPQTKSGDKNMVIRITDQRLLEATGGIVQGMSGSPIIQDGKLVGAVTHVLVNDPTTGYGIFIENMLAAAG